MNLLSKLFKPKVIDCPFPEKTEAKRTKVVFDKDVQFIYGKPFKYVELKDGFELTLIEVVNGRTDKITELDQEQIKYRGLKVDKYAKIKLNWARGLSVRQLAKEMSIGKGFSKGTIETYYAAINACNPLP